MSDADDLPRTKIDGERHYLVDGEPYPSVTTVTGWSPEKKRALSNWEDRVGHQRAEEIRDEAALMGTLAHHRILNQYALRRLPKPEVDFSNAYDGIVADVETAMAMWNDLDLDLGTTPEIETRIVSHDPGYAGTFDAMADDGTVIDLKTSSAIRDSHRWQIAAYFKAIEKDPDLPEPTSAKIVRLDPDPETNPRLEPQVEALGPAAVENHFDTFTRLLSEYGPEA